MVAGGLLIDLYSGCLAASWAAGGRLYSSQHGSGERCSRTKLALSPAAAEQVYVVYFKTNKRAIHEYPNLSNYVRDLYQMPGEQHAAGREEPPAGSLRRASLHISMDIFNQAIMQCAIKALLQCGGYCMQPWPRTPP